MTGAGKIIAMIATEAARPIDPQALAERVSERLRKAPDAKAMKDGSGQ